ncbi:cytochrome P450 [Massilia cavernae]|uniref:Cytochrome P450 n=1 Tax=Massilia cavernae TaxID=2320864 RepID=A0A418Y0N6_9BURK|nr:cytochrome P450 [Massilia cavernae]RJG18858.1 cytochrome P450 [Massilia cavernae]
MTSPNNIPGHVAAERVFSFDIHKDSLLQDGLHEGYAKLIEQAPDVFYTPKNGGHWVVTRFAYAEEILRDPANFTSSEMEIPRIAKPMGLIPINLDPPHSVPYRHVLMPYFSPKSVAEREESLRTWARHFVSAVAAKGSCDFLKDIASQFPVTVFMEMMGIPFDRLESFRAIAEEYLDDIAEARRYELAGQVHAIMMELIEARRIAPGDDLVSVLVNAQVEGRPLNTDELLKMTLLLFLGGLDTVVNVLTFSYRALAEDPALQARLVRDPAAIPGFIEECLRLFGVVNVPRMVARDVERFGVAFRAGDMVLCLNSQLGREARENPDPLTIDVDRKNRRLLTFSTGAHLCVGHNLARSEMRILTEEWLKQIPQFHVSAGFAPKFRAGMVMSLKDLPLEWTPAPAAS